MKTDRQTGKTLERRRVAIGVLLACSALTATALSSPAAAQSRSVFPPQGGSLPSLAGSTSPSSGTTSGGAQPSRTGSPQTSSSQSATDQTPDGQAQNGDPNVATGTVPRTGAANIEQPYEEDLNQPSEQPLDPGAEPVETQEAPRTPGDPTGIRLGSFLLRPSVNQGVNTEITRSSGTKTRRDYLSTAIRGTMTSDWSRHSLTVTGEGTLEHNLSGGSTGERPEAKINADLRLDVSRDTVAHITGGYSFTREDDYDPNAVGGAATQSGVNQFTGGASVQHDFGKVRGTAAIDLTRSLYTDAKLASGGVLSMKDRDNSNVDGRLRLGYELSPALIPYVEVATGHTYYDLRHDSSGYARSSQSYAARTGVEFDLGEKLRGEIGTGYEIVDYEDSRLSPIDAITFNGSATWSPQRGTNVDLGLRTTVQDSTTPGQSGWVEYALTGAVSHELRDNLTASIKGGTTLRDFPVGQSDGTVWTAGAGLTWAINPYLDLTSTVEYERAKGGGSNEKVIRAGVGLSLKR